jgi:TRAP-type C4-dicarboxylate transport system permease small subunit
MNDASQTPRTVLDLSDGALEVCMRWGSVLCLVGLWVLISAGVFVRFVPISSMGWADEIVELAFAWMVFLGAAALWRDRTHFRVELIPHLLRGTKAERSLETFLEILSLVFLLVFTSVGGMLTLRATDRSPILEYPRWIFYLVLPVSGAIMIGYTVRDLCRLVRGPLPQSPAPPSSGD